jgi:DNA invertase Pin-like site-specific DNA recombinase
VELIAYYRVSTQRQGQSGLGLEAQQAKVEAMAAERGATVVAEFVEVESGRKNARPKLAQALAEARQRGAVIAIAKLDRLARDAEFVLRLSREAQSNGMGGFLFCDMPDIDATSSAGRFMLTMLAAAAEFEARRISERTKDALAAAKARGVELGAQLPKQAAANSERAQLAQREAERLRPVILPLRQQGMSLAAIAEALTASGVATTGGGKRWAAMSVKRVLERLEAVSVA